MPSLFHDKISTTTIPYLRQNLPTKLFKEIYDLDQEVLNTQQTIFLTILELCFAANRNEDIYSILDSNKEHRETIEFIWI